MNIASIISVRAMIGFGVKRYFSVAHFQHPERAYGIMDNYFDGAIGEFATGGIWYSFPEHRDAFLKSATQLFYGGTEKGLRSIQNVLQCDQSDRACLEPVCPYCQLFAVGKITSAQPRPKLHLNVDPEILLSAVRDEICKKLR